MQLCSVKTYPLLEETAFGLAKHLMAKVYDTSSVMYNTSKHITYAKQISTLDIFAWDMQISEYVYYGWLFSNPYTLCPDKNWSLMC